MPDLNDFYAYKKTSGGSDNGGGGCFGSVFIWVIVILGFISFIGKL